MSQLSFFLLDEPPAPALPAPEPEPVALEGQLGLFDGPSAELVRIASMLTEARFSDALRVVSNVARSFSQATIWRVQLALLYDELDGAGGDPEALAALALRWSDRGRRTALPAALGSAIVRGLHRACAEAAEATALGTVVASRPTGWYWQQAGCDERARASLEATAARGELVGMSLTMQANLALKQGDLRAGVLYRSAFARDPAGVPVAEISDPAVRELVDEARELDLAPPEAWALVVGEARGVLPRVFELSCDEKVSNFQTLLLRSREATRRGTPDTVARRGLKELAPALFELLRDEGRL